jgi:hypothetical protein
MLSKILDKIIGLNGMSLLNQIKTSRQMGKTKLSLQGKGNVVEMVIEDV